MNRLLGEIESLDVGGLRLADESGIKLLAHGKLSASPTKYLERFANGLRFRNIVDLEVKSFTARTEEHAAVVRAVGACLAESCFDQYLYKVGRDGVPELVMTSVFAGLRAI